MTAPSYCILDGDGGSHAPALPATDCETLGGGLMFLDDTVYPPRPHEHPSSLDWMQMEMVVQRLCQTSALVTVWAHGNGSSAPVIDAVRSMVSAVTSVTITPARVSAGAYTLTLPTGKLPAKPGYPKAWSNTASVHVTAKQVGNVVQVSALDDSGTPTDSVDFIVDIFGGA